MLGVSHLSPTPHMGCVAPLASGSPGLGNSAGTGLGLGLSERGTQERERAWNWAGRSRPEGCPSHLQSTPRGWPGPACCAP